MSEPAPLYEPSPAPGKRAVSAAALDAEEQARKVRKSLVQPEPALKPGQMSTTESKTTKFTNALTGNCEFTDGDGNPVKVLGILRARRRDKRPNCPYAHQRKCCKRALPDNQPRMLICHDPGTGKTFTFGLIVAAMHTLSKGARRKTLVSAPASCLEQWKEAVLDMLRIPESRILMTNKLSKITAASLAEHDFIIVSRDLIGRAYSQCHEWISHHHQNERGNWLSQWDVKRGVKMHPLFAVAFNLFGIDEIQYCRNRLTAWTKGHEKVSMNSEKVEGLTATPIFNKPEDLVGISTAMDLPAKFKQVSEMYKDKQKTAVNLDYIRDFRKLCDRVTDDVLDLPPLEDVHVNFEVGVDPRHVCDYNEMVANARRLRCSVDRRGRATQREMQKLMAYLQSMQQYIVSPLLAEKGATAVQADSQLIEQASQYNTGALKVLKRTLDALQKEGYARIMVASCHTSLLAIANAYLARECPSIGSVISYVGTLSLKQRREAVLGFLQGKQTVLLMSIDAGGTGLHLVPGSNAVVFWGSRPFSPMQVKQTKHRVHRIGQKFPVKVVHLISEGSVDSAINFVHDDKLVLSRALMANDMVKLEQDGGKWRTTGRIVDRCKFLSEDGQFVDGDIEEERAVARLQGAPPAGPTQRCAPSVEPPVLPVGALTNVGRFAETFRATGGPGNRPAATLLQCTAVPLSAPLEVALTNVDGFAEAFRAAGGSPETAAMLFERAARYPTKHTAPNAL